MVPLRCSVAWRVVAVFRGRGPAPVGVGPRAWPAGPRVDDIADEIVETASSIWPPPRSRKTGNDIHRESHPEAAPATGGRDTYPVNRGRPRYCYKTARVVTPVAGHPCPRRRSGTGQGPRRRGCAAARPGQRPRPRGTAGHLAARRGAHRRRRRPRRLHLRLDGHPQGGDADAREPPRLNRRHPRPPRRPRPVAVGHPAGAHRGAAGAAAHDPRRRGTGRHGSRRRFPPGRLRRRHRPHDRRAPLLLHRPLQLGRVLADPAPPPRPRPSTPSSSAARPRAGPVAPRPGGRHHRGHSYGSEPPAASSTTGWPWTGWT